MSPLPHLTRARLSVSALAVVAALVIPLAPAGAGHSEATIIANEEGSTTFSYDEGDLLVVTGDVQVLSRAECKYGRFCIWRTWDFQGSVWMYTAGDRLITLPGAGLGSWYNRRVRGATLYEYGNGTGRSYCLPTNSNNPLVKGWLQEAEAVKLSSSQTSC